METLQKFAVPLAIIIAGGMVAVSLFLVNSRPTPADPTGMEPEVLEEIRSVQENDHIKGNPNAKIVIVEYSDTECPFCKVFHETMNRIISEYGQTGDVAWVYRHFPIPSLHAQAPKQAEALECAGEQGGNDMFWQYTDLLYATTQSNNFLTEANLSEMAEEVGLDVAAFESCVASGRYTERVDTDVSEVVAAGGRGTPHSIIIVDGEQIPLEGAQPYEVVKGLIDSLL